MMPGETAVLVEHDGELVVPLPHPVQHRRAAAAIAGSRSGRRASSPAVVRPTSAGGQRHQLADAQHAGEVVGVVAEHGVAEWPCRASSSTASRAVASRRTKATSTRGDHHLAQRCARRTPGRGRAARPCPRAARPARGTRRSDGRAPPGWRRGAAPRPARCRSGAAAGWPRVEDPDHRADDRQVDQRGGRPGTSPAAPARRSRGSSARVRRAPSARRSPRRRPAPRRSPRPRRRAGRCRRAAGLQQRGRRRARRRNRRPGR